MTTLRGGTYRTPPEVWRDLPPPQENRREVYMRRYLARWRRLHPNYSANYNRRWYAAQKLSR